MSPARSNSEGCAASLQGKRIASTMEICRLNLCKDKNASAKKMAKCFSPVVVSHKQQSSDTEQAQLQQQHAEPCLDSLAPAQMGRLTSRSSSSVLVPTRTFAETSSSCSARTAVAFSSLLVGCRFCTYPAGGHKVGQQILHCTCKSWKIDRARPLQVLGTERVLHY